MFDYTQFAQVVEMSDKTEDRPYNSAVIDNFLSYLSVKYPEIRVGPILREANIKPWEISDPGYWFVQKQVNDFMDAVMRRVKDVSELELARSVGRFTVSEQSNKFVRLAVIHLLRPENTFPVGKIIIAKFIKSIHFEWKKIYDSKYELIVTFRKTIRPKQFQCENFIGSVEAVIRLLTNKWPNVVHPECYFQGDKCCRYIISWEKERYYYITKISSIIFFITPILFAALLIFGTLKSAIMLLCVGILLKYHLKIHTELIKNRNSIETLKRNDFKILDLYDAMAKFHDFTNAFAEAARAISSQTSEDKVLETFSQSIQGLGYKKGIICLYEDNTNNLQVRHIFGYNESEIIKLENLKCTPIKGYVKSFKTIQMYDSMQAIGELLPSQILTQFSDIKEPLAVPMLYEGSLIGIVVAQNERGHKKLNSGDIFLIQAIASQTALIITNISAFETVSESEKLKNQFLSIASHELRTPIQAIFFAYDDLIEKLSDEKKAEISHSLIAIEKGIARLGNIIDNLLSLSKIEAHGAIQEKEVYVADIIEHVAVVMENIIGSAKHNLIIKNHLDPHEILICDEGLLIQVIINIVTNASKFTPVAGTIILKAYKSRAEFCIDVIDNGCGVPENAHQKIFMKFYQINKEGATIENDGCGLGLSFCKEVVQKHGGYISLVSPLSRKEYPELNIDSDRKGSLFRVHLPLELLSAPVKREGVEK